LSSVDLAYHDYATTEEMKTEAVKQAEEEKLPFSL